MNTPDCKEAAAAPTFKDARFQKTMSAFINIFSQYTQLHTTNFPGKQGQNLPNTNKKVAIGYAQIFTILREMTRARLKGKRPALNVESVSIHDLPFTV